MLLIKARLLPMVISLARAITQSKNMLEALNIAY